MRQARHEFGDDVMLVTSRVASPEFRYLGDFEVVFAVDESETGPKAANLPQPQPETAFGEMFRMASAVPPVGDSGEGAIAGIHALLVDMGLEPATTDAMIGLIRSCSSRSMTQSILTSVAQDPVQLAPENESADRHQPLLARKAAEDVPLSPEAEENAIPSSPVPTLTSDKHANDMTVDQRLAGLEARLGIRRGDGVRPTGGDGGRDLAGNSEAEASMPAAFGICGTLRRSAS
jgi:hypothetical protein